MDKKIGVVGLIICVWIIISAIREEIFYNKKGEVRWFSKKNWWRRG